jgi:PE-PGRS family protein with aspartyl peptidase-like domain/uncharacterized protein DUF3443
VVRGKLTLRQPGPEVASPAACAGYNASSSGDPSRQPGAGSVHHQRVRPWALASLVAAGLAACGGSQSLPGTASGGGSTSVLTVPVTVAFGPGTAAGARPMVSVRVGASRAVRVLLDTGSVGLRLFSDALDGGETASGMSITSTPSSVTYAGGTTLDGVLASATITVGSQQTTSAVPFALVRSASCTEAKPQCEAAGGLAKLIAGGRLGYGVLGIGTRAPGSVPNPLLSMPGGLGRSWSLHLHGGSGALVLAAGIPLPATAAATIQLAAQRTSGGRTFWVDDALPLCLTVGPAQGCMPSLLDSGTIVMQLAGTGLEQAPTLGGTAQVAPGTPVAVAVRGGSRPFWSFLSGRSRSLEMVTVEKGKPIVNTGVQVFFAFTVTYDDAGGTVTLVAA